MRIAVKEWFHDKKMTEMNRDVWNTDVFAILKETEKAYNVFVGDTTSCATYWVPKSCVIEMPETDENGAHHREALTNITWEEAKDAWNAEMSFYR